MLEKLKSFKWGYVILFVLLAASGVCFLAFSDTLTAIAIAVGILVAVFGIILATVTLSGERRGVGFALKMVISVSAIISGVITAVMRASAMEIIASLICLFLIVDGSFKLQTTVNSRKYRLAAWWIMLVPAVLCIIGGFIGLRCSPDIVTEDGVVRTSIIIGITLIISAIGNLLSAFFLSKCESNMKDDMERVFYARLSTDTSIENTADTLPVSDTLESSAENASEAISENNGTDSSDTVAGDEDGSRE